jgi:hypothetical protein
MSSLFWMILWRQTECLRTVFELGDIVAYEFGLVDGMAVDDHKDRLGHRPSNAPGTA